MAIKIPKNLRGFAYDRVMPIDLNSFDADLLLPSIFFNMKYLIDTDWVIAHLDGEPVAVQLLAGLVEDGMAISLVTYGEIYEGVLYSRRWETAQAAFLEFLRWTSVPTLDEAIMRRLAGIRGDLRRREQITGDPDIMIAATAIHHDLTLVTRNRRHYERIPDLKLYQTG